MPVKSGSDNLQPMELPGISNLAICRFSYEGNLPAVRDNVDQNLREGKTLDSIVNNVDRSQRSPLHWACSGKHIPVAKYLMEECGANPRLPDDSQWTPLMIASSVGSAALVHLILTVLGPQANEAISERNENGQTALHYAASKNHLDVAKMLLDTNYADVNAADRYGHTPIHRAASRGHREMVNILLSAPHQRVNTSASDSNGNTALHLACEDNQKEIALTLIQFGFSMENRNVDEKSPLQLAPQLLRRYLEQNSKSPTV